LAPDTEVAYKVDRHYARSCEGGLIWNDPDLAIEWPVPSGEVIMSDKDAGLPCLATFVSPFDADSCEMRA
jgi:dTDP-4-dehydrorhamnose 3,5-epimerase